MNCIVDFVLELDKLKAITRKTKPLGLDRYENSAEHSWQIALFAAAAAPYADAPVDVDRVIRMLLIHDIGEIDTGDTMVYEQGGWAERLAAELVAVKRIFGLLPAAEAEAFIALWHEFNEGLTAESRFAQAIDRAMPVLQNLNNNGQSWREHGIGYERVVARCEGQIKSGSPALWDTIAARLTEARDRGWFGS